MAPTYSDINGKVQSHIAPRIVDNVYKSSFRKWRDKKRQPARKTGRTTGR